MLSTVHGESLCVHIRGELDLATHDRLTVALETLRLDVAPVLHLHLGRLDFCDSRGFTQIAGFTERVRRTGQAVSVDGAQASVRRLSGLLGRSEVLGLG